MLLQREHLVVEDELHAGVYACLRARNEYIRPGFGRSSRRRTSETTAGTRAAAAPRRPRRARSWVRGSSRSSAPLRTTGKALITESHGPSVRSSRRPAPLIAPSYCASEYAFSPPASR